MIATATRTNKSDVTEEPPNALEAVRKLLAAVKDTAITTMEMKFREDDGITGCAHIGRSQGFTPASLLVDITLDTTDAARLKAITEVIGAALKARVIGTTANDTQTRFCIAAD